MGVYEGKTERKSQHERKREKIGDCARELKKRNTEGDGQQQWDTCPRLASSLQGHIHTMRPHSSTGRALLRAHARR